MAAQTMVTGIAFRSLADPSALGTCYKSLVYLEYILNGFELYHECDARHIMFYPGTATIVSVSK